MRNNKNKGTIFFMFIVLVPVFLIFGYFAWVSYNMNNFVQSVKNTIEFTVEETKKSDNQFTKIKISEFIELNQKKLFVGGEKRKEKQLMYGIEFESIDGGSINYQIDFLENWKKIKTLKGNALLDLESINSNKNKIEDRHGENYAAVRFYGVIDTCEFEFLISKEDNINSSFSIVRTKCGENWKDLTSIMYYK